MITSVLMGGCGNQMFQYACGLAQARRLGVDLQLDVTHLGGKRKYVLDQWDITTPTVSGIAPTVYENGMGYNDAINAVEDGACLQGYWQSEKYFLGIKDVIRRVFVPKKYPDDVLTSLMLDEPNAVSVHIRRDDYLVSPHKEFHGVLDFDYYDSAKKYIEANVRNPKFFIFCEDDQWAQTYFQGPDTVVVAPGSESRDIYLMSLCTHAIVANSSFSWWGSWLRKCDWGISIAPRMWFQDPWVDQTDIVPSRWHRI